VQGFVDYWGREHTLFFTTTDGQNVHPREYAKRWHSWLTNAGDWVKGFLKVLEPQKNGRPHYHNLVGVDFDTKADAFDWEAFADSCEAYKRKDWATFRTMRARYKASAAPELVELWARTREEMKRYGLGRCEILPVRKLGAISEYVGKYLEKGSAIKPEEWKGVRRVELDRGSSREWKRCGRAFSWSGIRREDDENLEEEGAYWVVRSGAWWWRKRVGELAFALGLPNDGDIGAISRALGPRWAYRLRGAITTADQNEWVETLNALSVDYRWRTGRPQPLSPRPAVEWVVEMRRQSRCNLWTRQSAEKCDVTVVWADPPITRESGRASRVVRSPAGHARQT
jgi:hypothetical protein